MSAETCLAPGCSARTDRGICDACDRWVDQQVDALTPTAEKVTALLRRTRMRVGSEDALQQSIEDALVTAGYDFEREARLSAADRIDFMVGDIGIEAKARYAKRAIYRQLERYAAQPRIAALILVTGTAIGMPAEIGGKPVFVVSTGRAAL